MEEPEQTAETVASSNNIPIDSDDDEEEYECRVCRGPAEEGRLLFSPCKCSGSIGLTHQDCLTSWLAVTRGEGRCELCKVKFHFAPRYAENAPERLSVAEVFLGLSRSALARWLPFLFRLTFCLSLWLVVAPLSTAYLYHIWVNRSLTGVRERWTWQLLPSDTVSGMVLMTIILVSFLSLMSFADFLRVEWQQQHREDPPELDAVARRRRDIVNAAEDNNRRQHEIDHDLLDRFKEARARMEKDTQCEAKDEGANASDEGTNDSLARRVRDGNIENPDDNLRNGSNIRTGEPVHIIENDVIDANNIEEMMRHELEVDGVRDPPGAPPRIPRPQRRAQPNNNGMDVEPPMPDDQVDMEINVALDELLGLRGPLSSLLRNLLWLLVFNTVYLGFFTFVPRTIGSAVYSTLLNTTAFDKTLEQIPLLRSENGTSISLKASITVMNAQSENLNTVFRLTDLAAVNLGYFFCAGVVIVMRYSWLLLLRFRRGSHSDNIIGDIVEQAEDGNVAQDEVEGDEQVGQRANPAADHDIQHHPVDRFEHPWIALGEAVSLMLDATVAVVKVGILLFLKMFLLPVLLGIWLDASSMDLFGCNAEVRLEYAGSDVFSFVLLHWVAGITFMLLVTVSVLQLREVAHSDLLAHLIRPQEPQPDLLGNLLHDSVLAQSKRMMLSLGIYTVLLILHISIPVRILTTSGISQLMPFLKLKFWYMIMPQLQVPLELLVFHLSMLALLERYKNSIGEMQHHWLAFMTSRMGLVKFMLPHDIEKFRMIGHIPLLEENSTVNQTLYELAIGMEDHDRLLRNNMVKTDLASPLELTGETRDNGERVLDASHAYIALPGPKPPAGTHATTGEETKDALVLLPTMIGRFRFKRMDDPCKDLAIEVWEEVPGKPIPRPPEGWDDLGAGGADIQGRWAWGAEKRSKIEQGVAHRPKIFGQSGQSRATLLSLSFRFFLLLVLSWCATTTLLVVTVAAPLGVGRAIFFLLRVPDSHVHTPWVFAVGSLISFPLMARLGSFAVSLSAISFAQSTYRWIRSMRLPPQQKGRVVLSTAFCWFFFCPLALGASYEICLIKKSAWFAGEEELIDMDGLLLIWMVGSIILNTWACLCSLSIFTKDFWVNLGNGIVEIEGDRGRRENAVQAQEGQGPFWQGKEGRIAKFFGVWKSILLRWEWDAVDPEVLLKECAIPVSTSVGVLLLVPSLCYSLWFCMIEATVGMAEISGTLRLYIFRLASGSTLFLQLCHTFRGQIQKWFSAVHKTARDDRYLIGEVLLNYES